MWDSFSEEIPEDIKAEILDKAYAARTHGNRACYAAGCRGPLCRKAERDRGLIRHREKAQEEGKTVTPKEAPHPARERDELLDRIISWHRHERGLDSTLHAY